MVESKAPKLDNQLIKLLAEYRQSIEADGITIDRLLLFGSYAKGTAHPWSDVDVAVVSKNFGQDYWTDRTRLMKLDTKSGSMIEPHPFHPDDLNNRWSTLATEIRRWGILIE